MTANENAMRLMCFNKAASMWAEFTASEKAGCRFGMFPTKQMQAADKEGFDPRLLAVAIMDHAKADGGMVA